MYKPLYETYYSIEMKEQYLVQTQLAGEIEWNSLTRGGTGTKKMLDTSMLLEKQKPQLQDKQVVENRPRLGQGRAGMRCKKPQPAADITTSTSKSCKVPTVQNVTKVSMNFPVPEQLITHKTEIIT